MPGRNESVVWGRVAAVVLLCTASVAKPILGVDLAGDLIPGGKAQSGALSSSRPKWVYRLRITEVGVFRVETMGYTQVQLQLFGPATEMSRTHGMRSRTVTARPIWSIAT